jgi:hypothetical protein
LMVMTMTGFRAALVEVDDLSDWVSEWVSELMSELMSEWVR